MKSRFAILVMCGCSSQQHATGLATDGVSLYWSTDSGTIEKAPASGGSATTLATNAFPVGMFVDAANVYWTECAAELGGCSKRTLFAMPANGGPRRSISLDGVGAFTSNGAEVFWIHSGASYQDVGIFAEPIAGGVPARLGPASGAPGIVADATTVYYMRTPNVTTAISLADGTSADITMFFVMRDLALDSQNLYVLRLSNPDTGAGDVVKIPRDGSDITILASNQQHLGRIAVDATHVYWTNAHPCDAPTGSYIGVADVERVPIDGGTVETIGTNADPFGPLAVTNDTVSWLAFSPQCGGITSGPIETVNK